MTKFVLYFDTETTGFPNYRRPAEESGQPHLIQLSALLVDERSGTEVDCLDAILAPDADYYWYNDIPQQAIDVHGITVAKACAEGRDAREVMREFGELWDMAEVCAAYGMAFDAKMIRGAFRRCGLPDRKNSPQIQWCAQNAVRRWAKMDPTPAMIRWGRANEKKTPKLKEAYEIFFGEPLSNAHNARADMMALRRIIEHCRRLQHADLSTGKGPTA